MTSTPRRKKKKEASKVKPFSVLVYISLPLKLLFLLSYVWMLSMFSFLSNHIPFIFLDKRENILRSLPGEKLRFWETATRLYHFPSNSPTPTVSWSHLRNVSCKLLEVFGQVLGLTHITPRLLVNLTQAKNNVLGGSNLPGLLVWLTPSHLAHSFSCPCFHTHTLMKQMCSWASTWTSHPQKPHHWEGLEELGELYNPAAVYIHDRCLPRGSSWVPPLRQWQVLPHLYQSD